jgi:anti-sigma factor RsiW
MSGRHDCAHGLDAGAFVLDALEPGERAAFERHLAACERCRDEVAHLRVAAEALPLSPGQLAPPPALKARLMAVVHEEAELLAAAGPQADRVDAPADAGREAAPEPVAPTARRPRRAPGATPWWRRSFGALRPLPAAGLATVLLAVGVGVGAALQGDAAPAARTVAADVALAGGQAHLVVTGDHARLVAEGLQRPARDRVYQVWILRKGETAPSPTDALFRTTADGRASVDVPADVRAGDKVLVTAEPDGGSAAPTSRPVVSAALA